MIEKKDVKWAQHWGEFGGLKFDGGSKKNVPGNSCLKNRSDYVDNLQTCSCALKLP